MSHSLIFYNRKLVKEYGADVGAKDSTGVSVLMAAALKGSLGLVI